MTEEVKITESGMTFVLPKEKLFYIEPYAQQNDFKLKTVEFVWWENNEMRFIEAKSSAPNAKSGNPALPEYISTISEKWINSIHIAASKFLGVLPGESNNLKNWGNIRLKLYLVLGTNANGQNFRKEWLPDLQNAFNMNGNLKSWRKVWSPKDANWIKVVNEEMARKIGILPAR